MDNNIEVQEHLYSYIKYWDTSICFSDRIFFVILKEGAFAGKEYVTNYLNSNGFNLQTHGIYTRFKNRRGEFISQDTFDGENNIGLRVEMIRRITDRIPK